MVICFVHGCYIRISYWCVAKLSGWNERFIGNFWGVPNLSSSCDDNHIYVKHVFFKNFIFGRLKMIKKLWKFKSHSASTLQKEIACGAHLRQICEAFAIIAEVPIVCQIFARKLARLCVRSMHPQNTCLGLTCVATQRQSWLISSRYSKQE